MMENRHLEKVISLLESGTPEDIEKANKIIKAQGTSFKELLGLVDVPADQSKLPAKKGDLRAYSCAIHKKEPETVQYLLKKKKALARAEARTRQRQKKIFNKIEAKKERKAIDRLLDSGEIKKKSSREFLLSLKKWIEQTGKKLTDKQKKVFERIKRESSTQNEKKNKSNSMKKKEQQIILRKTNANPRL
jgi:hypothetical protein